MCFCDFLEGALSHGRFYTTNLPRHLRGSTTAWHSSTADFANNHRIQTLFTFLLRKSRGKNILLPSFGLYEIFYLTSSPTSCLLHTFQFTSHIRFFQKAFPWRRQTLLNCVKPGSLTPTFPFSGVRYYFCHRNGPCVPGVICQQVTFMLISFQFQVHESLLFFNGAEYVLLLSINCKLMFLLSDMIIMQFTYHHHYCLWMEV